jgi:NAD(P)-dependent dehydrogenase (short-subunit alcohol dehydrogenase family)
MPSVLVTGAGRGIGKSIVEHLASRGWDVVAGVRSERDAGVVTALYPQRISSVILDVTDAGHIAKLDASCQSGWTRSSTTRALSSVGRWRP